MKSFRPSKGRPKTVRLTATEAAAAKKAQAKRSVSARKLAPSGKRRAAATYRAAAEEEDFEIYRGRPGSLLRTRRLIMAAVRLWELRRGLRDW